MATPDIEHLFRYTGEFSETIIASAGGAFVRDRDGREILDFTSGQMSAILGHSHPEIVATVGEAVARLDHLHSSFLSDVVLEFSRALSALLPPSLSKVLPLSTGAESNEAAIRMAKLATGRFEVVAFDRSLAWRDRGRLPRRPSTAPGAAMARRCRACWRCRPLTRTGLPSHPTAPTTGARSSTSGSSSSTGSRSAASRR